MTKNETFTFNAWGETYQCQFVTGRYPNGNHALRIVDAQSGEPIATASTNYDITLPPDYIFIKDWSENAGMTQVLMDLGIIEAKPRTYGEPQWYKLTKSGMELFMED